MKRYITRTEAHDLNRYASKASARRSAKQEADRSGVTILVYWCDDTGKPKVEISRHAPSPRQ